MAVHRQPRPAAADHAHVAGLLGLLRQRDQQDRGRTSHVGRRLHQPQRPHREHRQRADQRARRLQRLRHRQQHQLRRGRRPARRVASRHRHARHQRRRIRFGHVRLDLPGVVEQRRIRADPARKRHDLQQRDRPVLDLQPAIRLALRLVGRPEGGGRLHAGHHLEPRVRRQRPRHQRQHEHDLFVPADRQPDAGYRAVLLLLRPEPGEPRLQLRYDDHRPHQQWIFGQPGHQAAVAALVGRVRADLRQDRHADGQLHDHLPTRHQRLAADRGQLHRRRRGRGVDRLDRHGPRVPRGLDHQPDRHHHDQLRGRHRGHGRGRYHRRALDRPRGGDRHRHRGPSAPPRPDAEPAGRPDRDHPDRRHRPRAGPGHAAGAHHRGARAWGRLDHRGWRPHLCADDRERAVQRFLRGERGRHHPGVGRPGRRRAAAADLPRHAERAEHGGRPADRDRAERRVPRPAHRRHAGQRDHHTGRRVPRRRGRQPDRRRHRRHGGQAHRGPARGRRLERPATDRRHRLRAEGRRHAGAIRRGQGRGLLHLLAVPRRAARRWPRLRRELPGQAPGQRGGLRPHDAALRRRGDPDAGEHAHRRIPHAERRLWRARRHLRPELQLHAQPDRARHDRGRHQGMDRDRAADAVRRGAAARRDRHRGGDQGAEHRGRHDQHPDQRQRRPVGHHRADRPHPRHAGLHRGAEPRTRLGRAAGRAVSGGPADDRDRQLRLRDEHDHSPGRGELDLPTGSQPAC